MAIKDIDNAIALITKHRNSIIQNTTGTGSSLLNVVQFNNAAYSLGLSIKSASVLCYIFENGSASIEQLKLAGIASTNNDSIGSMFRGAKLSEKELIKKENSGYRNVGRIYKLTEQGVEIAARLVATLEPV